MENIQVIKTNGSFTLNLKSGEKKVSYQSLECVVNEFNLHLEENASLELLTFNNGNIDNVIEYVVDDIGTHILEYDNNDLIKTTFGELKNKL